jgi:hypothetical protein
MAGGLSQREAAGEDLGQNTFSDWVMGERPYRRSRLGDSGNPIGSTLNTWLP